MLGSRTTLRGLRSITAPLKRSLHKSQAVCSRGLILDKTDRGANRNEFKVLLFHRDGLHTTRVLGEEVKVIVCPAFADSISEGDVRWEKAVGDSVSVDEVICEIETDKTSVPVPSPANGVVEELLVEDGSTVSPGAKLLKIKIGGAGSAPAPKK